VVVAFGPEIALKAAVAASQTIPIVMIAVNFDPIAGGYVTDIARPNRNITGLVYRAPELAGKQLELLVQAFPDNNPIATLWEPASVEQFDATQRTAQSLHVELRSHKVENPPFDFDEAFKGIAQDRSRMLLVLSGPSFAAQRGHIADLRDTVPSADDVHVQNLCRSGRANVVRHWYRPDSSPCRIVRSQDSQGGKAVRSSSRAAN
jgi:putative ABC transport system substrate-binding protein